MSIVVDRDSTVLLERGFVRRFDSDCNTCQTDRFKCSQRFLTHQVNTCLNRELNFLFHSPDRINHREDFLSVQSKQWVAKLERLKSIPLHRVGHLINDRQRIAKSSFAPDHDVGAVVALERTPAALLNKSRRETPKIVVDTKFLVVEERPIRHRQRIKIRNASDADGRLGGLHNVVPFPKQLFRFALDDGGSGVSKRFRHRERDLSHDEDFG